MLQIKRILDHMAPNYFGSSAKAMGQWHAASHVEVINSKPSGGGGPQPKPKTP
jgi:hypothetical protein